MKPTLPQVPALAAAAVLLGAAFVALRRLQPLDEHIPEFVAAALAASGVYFIVVHLAFSWTRTSPAALAVALAAAVAFRALLLPLPPTLSDDIHRYVWDGRVQLAGHNPYLVTPADPALLAHRPPEFERIPGREVPTAYGPLTELVFRAAAAADGWFAFKLVSVFFDLATILVLLALLHSRGEPLVRVVAYAWCPPVVVEFAGSGHNDSLPLFGLLLALLLLLRGQKSTSGAALAAATLAKWFPVIAAPFFWRRTGWRGAVVFAAVALALVSPYAGAGWGVFSGARAYAEHWRNNASLFELVAWASGSDAVAGVVAVLAVAGLAVFLYRTEAEPLRASFILLAAVLLVSPSVFPWYVVWLVPFLCFYPNPAVLLWSATVLVSYHVVMDYRALGLWRYSPALAWLEYVPVYALLAGGAMRRTLIGAAGRGPMRAP